MSRPINLLIVAITMYVLRYLILSPIALGTRSASGLELNHVEFFLHTLVVVLLTASGNIINDYFDIKVDKINKPEKVVVGVTVKRRVAMVLNHGLNATAVLISAFLSWKHGQIWGLIIPVLIATLLWFYSPIFKKQVLVGNVIVAFCVAIIPFWTSIYELHVMQGAVLQEVLLWLSAYTAFAFLISLSREAFKDLEDLEGDRAGEYHTLPLATSIAFAQRYAGLMMLLCLIGAAWFYHQLGFRLVKDFLPSGLLILSVHVPGLLAIYYGNINSAKKSFTKASHWAKWTMAGGIICCALAGYFYL